MERQVRALWRQEQQVRTHVLDAFTRLLTLVAGEVVKHHDLRGLPGYSCETNTRATNDSNTSPFTCLVGKPRSRAFNTQSRKS